MGRSGHGAPPPSFLGEREIGFCSPLFLLSRPSDMGPDEPFFREEEGVQHSFFSLPAQRQRRRTPFFFYFPSAVRKWPALSSSAPPGHDKQMRILLPLS